MNYYIANPEEYKRVIRIIEAGLRQDELSLILRGQRVWQFAQAIQIETQNRGKRVLVNAILRKVQSGKFNIEPELKVNKPVEVEETEKEIIDGPVCDGCGGVSTYKELLRWGKVLKGESVSYRIKYSTIPDYLKEFLTPEKWSELFGMWAAVCGITFKEVKSKGDIVIGFDELDGIGNVLGAAYQPATGFEMDVGDLSGDITFDNAERWNVTNYWTLLIVILHEIGHAIGLKHSTVFNSILHPTPLNAGPRGLHTSDINNALDLYPLPIAA